jgi:hypothetical protein
MITYKSIQIAGNSGHYTFVFNHQAYGPFAHYYNAERAIDRLIAYMNRNKL